MKKALLTAFVVVTFILYSLHNRHDGSSLVLKPNPVKTTNNQPATPPANNNGNSASASTNPPAAAMYKDGQYTGSAADAFYGFIQVMATISGGKLTDVRFLQYPNDNPNSVNINSQAMPYLKQEAVQAQSANVNIVSGATDTSQAFIQSLSSALNKAHS
jgi:uncharacterized protein with FMN-binding domain